MPPAILPTAASVAARTLYLYAARAIAGGPAGGEPLDQEDVLARTLYLYESLIPGGHPAGGEPLDGDDVLARALYAYYSLIHDRDPSDVAARALYTYEAYAGGELFPWIERIVPNEALPGAQVEIHGDGFGATSAAEGSIIRLGSPVDPTQAGPGGALGIVAWQTRSPNLWPANSGVRTESAITATLPEDAESGMLTVEETI